MKSSLVCKAESENENESERASERERASKREREVDRTSSNKSYWSGWPRGKIRVGNNASRVEEITRLFFSFFSLFFSLFYSIFFFFFCQEIGVFSRGGREKVWQFIPPNETLNNFRGGGNLSWIRFSRIPSQALIIFFPPPVSSFIFNMIMRFKPILSGIFLLSFFLFRRKEKTLDNMIFI